MIEVKALLHASFLVSDLAAARRFYEGILGLTPNMQRPDLGYEGVWYDIGLQQLHLMALPDSCLGVDRPAHGGRDRHIAFKIEGLEELKQKLVNAHIPFTMSKSGRPALFCRDPDGNAIELIETTSNSLS
jgi:glyoxylase I family protein